MTNKVEVLKFELLSIYLSISPSIHPSVSLQLSLIPIFPPQHPYLSSPNSLYWSMAANTLISPNTHAHAHTRTHAHTQIQATAPPSRYTFNGDASGDSREEA